MIESPATHRHDIDGLRAVAILAVVLYHAGFPLFRGAFVGVDVFFVISGYFIAASLAASLQKPGFSVGQFYRRRAARIVPPLLVMTLCCVPAAHLLFLPQDYAMLGKTLISAGAFCSNLFFYSQGGYFDAPLEGNPFLHTWFLSIQGQFSLIFPLFFILVRRLRKGRETPVVALLFFASLLASAFMARYAPRAAYFFLASRGWELLAGALLALRIGRGNARDGSVLPAKLSETLALAAIASILMPIPLYTPRTPFPGLAALPPCIGAALLIWLPAASARPPLVTRLLGLRPLRFVGTISYSLYLWHWPILVFMRDYLLQERLRLRFALVGVVASVAVAWVSWYLLERKIRGGGSFAGHTSALFLPCLLLVMIGTGAAISISSGFPGRFPPAASSAVAALDEMRDAAQYAPCQINDPNREALERVARGDLCLLGNSATEPPLFFSWGDSHLDHFRPLLQKAANELSVAGVHLPTPGRLPLLGAYREYYDTPPQKRYGMEIAAAAVDLVKERRIPIVLLGGNWPGAESDLRAPLPDGEVARGAEALAAALEHTVGVFEENGAEVWIVKPIPVFPISVPRRLARDIRAGRDPSAFTLPIAQYKAKTAATEEIFRALAARHPDVRFIDPAATLCADGAGCLASVNGRPLYFDSNHFTRFGALYLEPSFHEFIAALREKARERQAGGW